MTTDSKPLAIVLVSGGLDSCVTAAIAAESYSLAFLHVNYGQRTEARERKAFLDLADAFGVASTLRLDVDISHLARIGGSSLTQEDIPVTDADLESDDIPSSYVPFRNANILSIATSWAEVIGAHKIFIGAVAEDGSGYPDCRPEFFDAYNQVIQTGTKPDTRITIEAPLLNMTKKDIVLKGMELKAPLAQTWSCYQAGDIACGVCDSCALRLRGFEQAGFADPLPYLKRPKYT